MECKDYKNNISKIIGFVIFINITLLALPAKGDVFMGAKVGEMMIDTASKTDPVNVGVNLGCEFDTLIADLSLVGETNNTIIDGETRRGGKIQLGSNGMYLLWKSTKSLFASLRGGLVNYEIRTGNTTKRSEGLLLGASVGIVIGRTRFQIEYTSVAGEAKYLAIGLEY